MSKVKTRFNPDAKECEIYCCGCAQKVKARLTNGEEVYPFRRDLWTLPFWRCDTCYNFVGCHSKTKTPTRPLGNIPTPELKKARQEIHKVLDPIWRDKGINRDVIYAEMTHRMGFKYHTAMLRDIDEHRKAWSAAKELERYYA